MENALPDPDQWWPETFVFNTDFAVRYTGQELVVNYELKLRQMEPGHPHRISL